MREMARTSGPTMHVDVKRLLDEKDAKIAELEKRSAVGGERGGVSAEDAPLHMRDNPLAMARQAETAYVSTAACRTRRAGRRRR